MQLIPRLTATTEAIAFQEASPFFIALTEHFQTLIDLREQMIADGKSNLAIIKGIRKQFTPWGITFKKIMQEHAGFRVSNLVFSNIPNFFQAISMNVHNAFSVENAVQRITGQQERPPSWIEKLLKQKSWTADQMIQVSKLLDKQSGKMDLSKTSKSLRADIQVVIYIDLNSLILGKEMVSPHVPRFLAEECAAIFLHEAGHMLSLVELASSQCRLLNIRATVEKDFVNRASPKERLRYTKHILTQRTKHGATPDDNETIHTYANASQKLLDELKDDPDKGTKGPVKKIIAGIESLLTIWILTIGLKWQLLFNSIINLISVGALESLGWSSTKQSDISGTATDTTLIERYADEFVSRHGAGSFMASGLNTFHQHYAPYMQAVLTALIMLYVKALRSGDTPKKPSYSAISGTSISSWILMHYWPDNKRMTSYELLRNRIQRMRQNTIEAMKDPNLPDEFKQYQLQQFEQITKELERKEKAQPKWLKATVGNLMKLIGAITDGATIADIVMDAKFRSKYSEVVDAAEELQHNPLFYHATKLELQSK